jgi:hypothetical protein
MLPLMRRRRTCRCGARFSVNAEQCPVCGLDATEFVRLGRGEKLATYLSAAAFIIGYHRWPVCDCRQRAKDHEGNKDVIWLGLAWHT